MVTILLQLAAGLVLSVLIGLLGYWRGSLTASGVLGAMVTGTLIFGFGGLACAALLVAFFVSSSALSGYRVRAKLTYQDTFEKGSRRDLGQALANGGAAALVAVALGFSANPLLFVIFVGAMAAVTADTWSTEVGVLSKRPPRSITSGRPVPPGTSGGITPVGTLMALAGGLLVGLLAAALTGLAARQPVLFSPPPLGAEAVGRWPVLVAAGATGGLLGSLFDSLLGATVQGIYFCDFDRKETERRIHTCGRPTRLIRGYAWLNNDGVNFLASLAGGLIALLTWILV